MELCSIGHDEIIVDGFCPACELLEQINKCPICRKNNAEQSDENKENERLQLLIYDLESKLKIEKEKNRD